MPESHRTMARILVKTQRDPLQPSILAAMGKHESWRDLYDVLAFVMVQHIPKLHAFIHELAQSTRQLQEANRAEAKDRIRRRLRRMWDALPSGGTLTVRGAVHELRRQGVATLGDAELRALVRDTLKDVKAADEGS
eukprot:gene6726-5515_t